MRVSFHQWLLLVPTILGTVCSFSFSKSSTVRNGGYAKSISSAGLCGASECSLLNIPATSFSFSLFSNQPESTTEASSLTPDQLDFTMGYLNKHHRDVLVKFAEAFTPLGVSQSKKNAFSGGSYSIENASISDIQYDTSNPYLMLQVEVQIRGEKEPIFETAKVYLDAQPNKQVMKYANCDQPVVPPVSTLLNQNPMDDIIRRMNRLCCIVNSPSTTGKLIQLGFQLGGEQAGLLKENMYLNQVPHNKFVRQYFYDLAADAVLKAVIACSEGKIGNRMKITTLFPEMNSSMDSYRIGTLLELAREVALTLAEQNLRVRVCVQGSMGVGIFTGTPKQLSGAATLLQRMDWQSQEGEVNEGILGTYINFGAVGKEHVVNEGKDRRGNIIEQDDVFLLLCPQSMVGVASSIIQPLQEMVDAAGDRPVILLNPDLTDKVSSQGQQNIRGRQDRIDFANSFKPVYHFQNTYVSGTSYFPILGAVSKPGYDEAWFAYQRRDMANNDGEVYVPILSTENHPDGQMILDAFE